MSLKSSTKQRDYISIQPPKMPTSLMGLGIPTNVVESLILKLLHLEPRMTLLKLSQSLAISSNIIQAIVNQLRVNGMVEVLQPDTTKISTHGVQGINSAVFRYQLTIYGEEQAKRALNQDGYIGPIPVSLNDYERMVRQQSLRKFPITQSILKNALKDVYGIDNFVDLIGPGINSGRAVLFYGEAGTGKSYIANRIIRSLNSAVYIPYSVYIAGNIVRLFTHQHHKAINQENETSDLFFHQNHDRRWVLCERPMVQVGGELTMNMLEVSKSESTSTWLAPLQMMANNGIFIVDDLGRQAMPISHLLNRWIVPMEYEIDYLSLPNGQQSNVPFVTTLIFSTNLSPKQIGDPAFLRRLGYKVNFLPLSESNYKDLWLAECRLKRFIFDCEPMNYLLKLHKKHQVNYYPCIPKDLTQICNDMMIYKSMKTRLTTSLVESAWQVYFSDLQK
ncbi:MAG: AAA family ATPase [Vibrio sp.]